MAPEIETQILSLYSLGTSYSDISQHFKKMYDLDYSPSFINSVTDRVFEEITIWKQRPLESVYAIIYLDAIHYKVEKTDKLKQKLSTLCLELTWKETETY